MTDLNTTSKPSSNNWTQLTVLYAIILSALAWMILYGMEDRTLASQSVTFAPEIQFNTHWTIPIAKRGADSDLNAKIGYLYLKCMETLNRPQCVRVVALVDHESAGSFSPTIKGDGGNSIGIAQWHRPSGRIAAKTFEGQVDQLIREISPRMMRHSLDEATCGWNSPRMRCGNYVSKVIKSERNFL